MMIFLHAASCILSAAAAAAAYTNSAPEQGHCSRDLKSRRSFDAGQSQSCLAATPTSDDTVGGLLAGIDVESAEYFSSKLVMNSEDDVQWLLEPGRLWEAATKDAQARGDISTEDYLESMECALEEFQEPGTVHDREAFFQFLKQVYESKGNFFLVLGGKSVGKSLVLRGFALNNLSSTSTSESKYWPLLVDARDFSGASLLVGILNSYKEIYQLEFGRTIVNKQDALKVVQTLVTLFASIAKDAAKAVDAALKRANHQAS
jgi:hypothetical protein